MLSPPGQSVKIVSNGVVSPCPSHSLVYNETDSRLVAAKWERALLVKNSAWIKCRFKLKERAELLLILFGVTSPRFPEESYKETRDER